MTDVECQDCGVPAVEQVLNETQPGVVVRTVCQECGLRYLWRPHLYARLIVGAVA